VLNAKFWDINLRYAHALINRLDETERQAVMLAALLKEMTGAGWAEQDRKFSRGPVTPPVSSQPIQV